MSWRGRREVVKVKKKIKNKYNKKQEEQAKTKKTKADDKRNIAIEICNTNKNYTSRRSFTN